MDAEEGQEISVEQEARNLGWTPKEEWHGDAEKWVDADEFVERGRNLMPILLANNKKLQKELQARDRKIEQLSTAVQDSQQAISTLEKHYTAANKRAVETAKEQLKAQLVEAREVGDVNAELEVLDHLDDLRKREAAAAAAPAKPAQQGQQLDPAFAAWNQNNQWFGQDVKRTREFMRIAEDLRDEGVQTVGAEFIQQCEARLAAKHSRGNGPSRVGSGGTTTARDSVSKSFASLPQEAKEACWRDAPILVGKGKRYKDKAAWEKAYAKIYYSEA